MNLQEILNEEIHLLLEDEYDDVDWDLFESKDRIQELIFDDFLNRNNDEYSKHAPWTVIPFNILKKVWEDYMKYGHVRYPKQLDKIEGIVSRNILKIWIFTELSEHTPNPVDDIYEMYLGGYVEQFIKCYFAEFENPDQLEIDFDNPKKGFKRKVDPFTPSKCKPFEDRFLEDKMKEFNLKEKSFDEIKEKLIYELTDVFLTYYIEDPKAGQARITDAGLKPLVNLLEKLRKESSLEKKLVLIDNILNVIHQRSDIAEWFVQGGSSALSELSGYLTPEDFDQRTV